MPFEVLPGLSASPQLRTCWCFQGLVLAVAPQSPRNMALAIPPLKCPHAPLPSSQSYCCIFFPDFDSDRTSSKTAPWPHWLKQISLVQVLQGPCSSFTAVVTIAIFCKLHDGKNCVCFHSGLCIPMFCTNFANERYSILFWQTSK